MVVLAQDDYTDPVTGIKYKYDAGGTSATLISGKSFSEWKVTIPRSIPGPSSGTVPVIGIGDEAFKDNTDIKYVKFEYENNVKTIGKESFRNCSNLQLLDLPKSLESISNDAFSGCSRLVHVRCENNTPQEFILKKFPNTLNNNNYATLYVPSADAYSSVTEWKNIFGDRIYEGDMIYFTTSDGTAYVGASVDLKATLLWGSNTTENPGKITVKKQVKDEEHNEIYNVISIGSYAFENNNNSFGNFNTLEIDDEINTIGNRAFYNWTNLNSLTLPENLTSIGDAAFQNCGQLELLTLPEKLRAIGLNAFVGCGNLKHVWCKVQGANYISIVCNTEKNQYSFPPATSNPMMTLYVPNRNYDIDKWRTFFNNRIFFGDMKTVDVRDRDDNMFSFVVCNNNESYKQATLLHCTASGTVSIPTNYKVTGIDKEAFKNQSGIVELIIPEYVATIGQNAFAGCNNLVRVESKSSTLITIPDNLFVINNNIEKILYCPSVSSYQNSKGWKDGFTYFLEGSKLDDKTFEYKDQQGKKICDITYATASSSSSDAIIMGVSNLDLPNFEVPATIDDKNVIGIYKDAFTQANSVEQLSFEDKEGTKLIIGKGALNGCSKLRFLKLPSRLDKLGSGAFGNCNSLAHILFKSDASLLGSEPFSGNTKNSATIYIPTGSALQNFVERGWNINNIVKADSLEEFKDIKYGMTYIGWKQAGSEKGTAKLTIGIDGNSADELFEIENSATSNRGTNYNVIGIANNAFSIKGIFKKLKIAEGIESIGASAFRNRPLTRIILPESMKSIGENAFNSCRSLIDIEPYEGKQLKYEEIGANAFQNCTSLEKVTLPSTLQSIGLSAFAGCTKLTEIESKIMKPYDIDVTVFPNYSATLYVPYSSYDAYTKTNGWKTFADHISAGSREEYSEKGLNYVYASHGKTATLIKSNPEEKNPEIRSIIPGTDIVVTAIAESAFKDNRNIESIIIPDSIKTIGAKAFENCTNVKKIELPKSLTFIGDNAFGGLVNLKTLISKIPADNLTNLCSSINNVFTSDAYPTITISPEIFIPVGVNSESVYKEKWSVFHDSKFVVGYPVYDKEAADRSGWYFDFLTTVDENEIEGDDTQEVVFGTATLKRAKERGESDGNLIVPLKVKFDKKVYVITKILDNAFNEYPNKSDVKNLIIPDSVTEIGANAFRGFYNVQKVWLPKSLTYIGSKAFDGCNAITHVCSKMENPKSMSDDIFSIPEVNTATLFVPSMSGYEAGSWSKFSNVVVGEYVNDYVDDKGMVFACSQKTVGEGEGATIVRSAILTRQPSTNNREALIPSSVKCAAPESTVENAYDVVSIGKYAFRNCALLDKIELPSTITSIGYKAFESSSKITTIISAIPSNKLDDLCDINSVFASDITPDFIYVPVGSIEDYQAKWNRFDSKLFLAGTPGYDTESAGNSGWFYDYLTTEADDSTKPLKGIATLKRTTKKIDEKGELLIPSEVVIKEKTYKVTKIADNAFNEYPTKSDVKNLVIPDSVTEIGANAFRGFSSVQKVRLPKSLTDIGSKAFDGCNAITHVCSRMESPKSMSDDIFSIPEVNTATLFVPSTEGYTGCWNRFSNIIKGRYDEDVEDGEMIFACYTVKGDGNETPDKKFAILTKPISTNITEALINDYVKTGGGEETYEVTKISKFAFKDCAKLTKIELPTSLTSIGEYAFSGCEAISEIISDIEKEHLFRIEDNVFSEKIYSSDKDHVTVYILDGTIDEYKNTKMGGWSRLSELYQIGKWMESGFMGDKNSLKFKYHTGTHEAELIEINFLETPNVEQRTLTIAGKYKLDGSDTVYDVNSIAPSKITNGNKIEGLIIEEGDKGLTIGTEAFKGCANLSTIKLPSNLKIIDSRAFQGCANLSQIDIPSNTILSTIAAYAFQNCTNLQKIWLPAALTSIGSKAFYGCNNLTRICIESLPTVENTDAFTAYSSALLFVPTGAMTTLGTGWRDFSRKYEGYYEDESPEGVDRAYIYLKQAGDKFTAILTNSKTPEPIQSSVTNINNNKSYDVTIIGKAAFTGKGLDLSEWSSLPESVVAIENDAFKNCKLKELALPSSLKTIGNGAFSANNQLVKITLPEQLNTLGNNAFKGCSSLEKIELPKNITTLGAGIFEDCSGLTEVISKIETKTVIESNAQSVPNAILYVPDGTANRYSGWDFLYTLEGDSKLARDVDGLDYAYTASENSGKKAVLIGVTKISEDGAVTIPESVTIENAKYQVVAIGKDVLNGNLNLKKLEIKASLASIGENAFSGCSNLSEIICDKYYKQLDALSQSDVLLYVPNETIKKSYVDAGWNSNHVYVGVRVEKEFEDGLKYVYTKGGSEAVLIGVWDKDKAIDKNGAVIIPDYIEFKVDDNDNTKFNVISIANSVFKDNTDVRMVTIGENIASIGENAFEGCTNLKEIVSRISDPAVISKISFSKPDAILFITDANLFDTYKAKWDVSYILVGERRAWNENGLYYTCATGDKVAILLESKASEMNKDVDIPGSIKFKVNDNDTPFNVIAIAENAFKGNTDITTLKIGESIKSIGASAFQGCIGLNKIWLPESLDSIAEKAFNGCNDISYICTKRATPQESISANVFSKTTSTLYVPYGSIGAYSANSVWGSFSKIKEGVFVDAINQEGVTYECVINEKDENVAQIVKAAASLTDVIIPSEVKLDQIPYRVAGIEDKAFEACTKLAVITSKISKENLFEFKKNVFPEAIYEAATVYAPYDTDGSTEAKYKDTEGWKYFTTYAKGEKKAATVGDLTYEYIIGVGTATITKAATNISKVSIDGTVTIDGAAYTVKAIGANAFKGCNGLKVVWLPATLESIDKTAFSGCNGIAYVSSAIDNPTAADANIFPSSATLFVPQGRKSSYNIGGWNNFAYVGEGRFVDAVTASDMSFDCYTDNAGTKKAILKKYNVNAATVEIPGSVMVGNDTYTVSIITKQAFASKTNMESLIIPSGVETIEAEAFNACSKLKWIESKIVNPISISNVFANTNATLFIPSNNVSDYKAKGWNFLNVFVGDRKQTDVDGWTYVYSTGDKKAVLTRVGNVGTNVTINGTFKIGREEYTVTSVGDAVFKGKSNIEALTIAKSIENIGANAFEGCVKLVSITCEGSSPAKLGADAFPSANVTVNVPNDAVNTYKNHPDWKQFGVHILGITTSVEDDPTGAYNIIVPAGGDATPEVEIWNGLDASGDVVIPEVVELNGSDYKVTGIAANAYDSNTDLTSIVIPSSITSIGASAFAGCTNLKSITVYCVTPINLSAVAATRRALTRAGGSSSVFEGVNKETCILYVPAESIDAYKQAEGWKDFKKIYAIGTNAINGIVVSEGKPFDVYNLQGRKVKAHTTTFSGLPAGVYIVNGKKVMVK